MKSAPEAETAGGAERKGFGPHTIGTPARRREEDAGLLGGALDAMSDAVLLCDGEAVIVHANRGARERDAYELCRPDRPVWCSAG